MDEFIAGTQPTNAASVFRIERVTSTGLFWTSVPGRSYSVERTGDLRQSSSPIASGLKVGSYAAGASTNGAAFYCRVRMIRD